MINEDYADELTHFRRYLHNKKSKRSRRSPTNNTLYHHELQQISAKTKTKFQLKLNATQQFSNENSLHNDISRIQVADTKRWQVSAAEAASWTYLGSHQKRESPGMASSSSVNTAFKNIDASNNPSNQSYSRDHTIAEEKLIDHPSLLQVQHLERMWQNQSLSKSAFVDEESYEDIRDKTNIGNTEKFIDDSGNKDIYDTLGMSVSKSPLTQYLNRREQSSTLFEEQLVEQNDIVLDTPNLHPSIMGQSRYSSVKRSQPVDKEVQNSRTEQNTIDLDLNSLVDKIFV